MRVEPILGSIGILCFVAAIVCFTVAAVIRVNKPSPWSPHRHCPTCGRCIHPCCETKEK